MILAPSDWIEWRDWCPICQRHVTFYTWRCLYTHRHAYHCRRCGRDAPLCVCERRRSGSSSRYYYSYPRRRRSESDRRFRIQTSYAG
jgi:hypothetical protein